MRKENFESIYNSFKKRLISEIDQAHFFKSVYSDDLIDMVADARSITEATAIANKALNERSNCNVLAELLEIIENFESEFIDNRPFAQMQIRSDYDNYYSQGWAGLGKYYGYPKCCIKEFGDGNSTERNAAGKGTGFIPCQKHALQIVSGKITLESLINKRLCKTSFPNCSPEVRI